MELLDFYACLYLKVINCCLVEMFCLRGKSCKKFTEFKKVRKKIK